MSDLITGRNGLLSLVCDCGRAKRKMHSFCAVCFRTLTPEMQRALYKRVGEGYEEAHAVARACLRGDDLDRVQHSGEHA